MVENVITFRVNVHVLRVLQDHCALSSVRMVRMAKIVNQSVNVKMMAHVIHKLANVNVHPVGLVKFVQIVARLVSMVCTFLQCFFFFIFGVFRF